MNILQVTRRFVQNDWGGTETVIFETSKQLLGMGHHTEIYCTTATAVPGRDGDAIGNLAIRRYPYFYPYLGLSDEAKQIFDRKGGSPFSFSLMRGLKGYANPDLMHLHGGNRIGGIARYVARKRRIPYVVSLHGGVFDVPVGEAQSWTAPAKGALEWGKVLGLWVGSRRVLDDAAAIICVGKREQELAQEHFPAKRVVHLPNGVDIERFEVGDGAGFRQRYGIAQDARVMLVVARIDSQKNQLFAVEALPKLLAVDAKFHLVLIGHVTNQAYCKQVEDAAAAAGVADRLSLIPGLGVGSQDLVDGFKAADCFLLPSIHEPFGIVILEAWAAGLPVLASRVGGIPSFVEDGRDGLLFEANDQAGFVGQVKRLVDEPGYGQALAAAGHGKARGEYSWKRITERLVAVYQEVLR